MTQRSPEERITSLEGSFVNLKEGLTDVKTALETLNVTVAGLVDRLDGRYPSKESVDLRVEDLRKDVDAVRKQADESKVQIDRMQRWQYQIMGAITLAAFLLGLLTRGFNW